ncbi:MAG: FimV/HubP family polar landmark protein [Steroidobacteraceae bacterium]
MVWRNSIRALPLLLALPGSALALGLGDIHLRSTLNAPLLAEIDLVGATSEELNSLTANLASRETFSRYGLDYPSFLSSVTLQSVRTSDGRNVIQLRSNDSITEPFAILLVEVNWARGRVVREYTVLLDPPVFTNNAPAAAAVAAPSSAAATPRSAAIERPAATAAAVAPAVAAPASGAGVTPGSSYQVRSGDSLSGIVARAYGSGRVNRDQALAGIYRANAGAFNGNMNELKRGSELRLPPEAELTAISPAEARAEVVAQSGSWKAARSSTEGEGRLRLVPPESAPAAAAPATAGTAASAAGTAAAGANLQQRVQQLESQLAETRRALELKNAELAALQSRAGSSAAAVASAPAAAPAAVPPAAQPAAPVAETPAPAPTTETAATPAEAPAPAAEAPKPVVKAKPAAVAATATDDDSLLGLLKRFWYLPAALLAALAAFIGMRVVRARQAELDDSLDRLMPAGALGGALNRGGGFGAANRGSNAADSFLVEESGSHEQPLIMERTAENPVPARSVTVDDTVSGDTAVALDQGDPLAEADFHMAYGLYDQAADLIRIALNREPERRDLKLKLLEVYFVWGNKEQFLATARELAASRDKAGAGEWEKVVIMGRQIAGDDPLFAEGGKLSGAGSAVDLNLEGGQNRVDFDLMGEPTLSAHEPHASDMDLDLGAALGEATGSTAEAPTVAQDAGVDFVLDDPARGAEEDTGITREMINEGDAPTVEQPQLRSGDNPTIREKLAAPLRQQLHNADQTAEVALDDLGLDLQGVELDGLAEVQAGADATRPNLGKAAPAPEAPSDSGTWLFTDEDLSELTTIAPAAPDAPTQKVNALDLLAAGPTPTQQFEAFKSEGVDLDVGNTSATSIRNRGLDLDVGPATLENDPGSTARTQRLSSDDIALPDLEPVTMSEVGTKLDLARAYMDMGDPEGARSILDEVLAEGSPSQKQEARRLLDTLPG